MDHEISVRIVDNQEYMKVVRSILEEGKEVPIVVIRKQYDAVSY